MSRWTRASIASSLLALSLAAASCDAAPTHDADEIRRAFAHERLDLSPAPAKLLRVFHEHPPVRPLDAFGARVRLAVSGSVTLPHTTPAPTFVFFGDNVDVSVFSSRSRAERAEDGYRWVKTHANEFREELRRASVRDVDELAIGNFDVRRRDNVVVTFPGRLERRVQAALDRLDR